MTKTARIVSVILAAGEAKRMGKTKQLLPWGKQTLIEHAIHQHLKAGVSDVYVILGADSERIKKQIKNLPVRILENKDWKSGLGTSIAAAARHLIGNDTKIDGLLIALTDQPLLDSDYLNLFIQSFNKNPQKITATVYGEKFGVPVLFPISYLVALSNLSGNKGASALINAEKIDLTAVDPRDKAIDIDTPEVYDRLCRLYFNGTT